MAAVMPTATVETEKTPEAEEKAPEADEKTPEAEGAPGEARAGQAGRAAAAAAELNDALLPLHFEAFCSAADESNEDADDEEMAALRASLFFSPQRGTSSDAGPASPYTLIPRSGVVHLQVRDSSDDAGMLLALALMRGCVATTAELKETSEVMEASRRAATAAMSRAAANKRI